MAYRRIAIGLACFFAGVATAAAQVSIERKTTAKPEQEIRIGVFANVKADCTAGPLPVVTLARSPEHGQVRVRPAKVRLTNHKTCLAIEIPGYLATYKSKPGYSGEDRVELDIKNPEGKVLQRRAVTITVGQGAAGGDSI